MRETGEALVVNEGPGCGPPPPRPDRVLEPLTTVSQRAGLGPLASRLSEIRRWLASDLAGLEAALSADAGGGDEDLARRAAAHLLGRPGKRIRPLCVFLASRAGDARPAPERVRDLAVAAELVHAATLLHDDVIDQGTERRGAPTARIIYGNPASVLGGDHLLVEALRRVGASGYPDMMERLLDVIAEMIAAEALQLERRGRFDPDRETYLRVVYGKTAVLFEWAMRAGARAGGLPEATAAALARAGTALGLAFQMVDDLLDLTGDPAVTGKDRLLDLREGKLTWPLIIACERDETLIELLAAIADDPTPPSPAAIRDLMERVLETGCLVATRRRARELADDARAELGVLPEGPARSALAAVVAAAVQRAQ